MKHLRAVLIILFVLLVIVLAVENHEAMSTRVKFKVDLVFLHYQTGEVSLYFITVLAFLVGVMVAALNGLAERFRLKRQIKGLVSAAKEKEAELNSLRNLPVTSENVSSEQPPPKQQGV